MEMPTFSDVIFSEDISIFNSEEFVNQYITHALCEKGSGSFTMIGKSFEIKENDFMIFVNPNLISNFKFSEDFKICILLISKTFINKNRPESNYDIIGVAGLFDNPILHLSQEEKELCREDILLIKSRLGFKNHQHYHELLGHLCKVFFLDLFHIHAQKYQKKDISERKNMIFKGFISLLEEEFFVEERQVQFYASQLSVTPKYLLNLSTEITGQTPQYWIDRFTAVKIMQLISERKYSFLQISEMLNFSSLSYFSRYVKRILGVSPRNFSEQ